MDKSQLLANVLQELKTAALLINSEESLKATMNKYDMLFLGEKFNCIDTIELLPSVNNVFGYEITNDEFLKLIPSVCDSLKMKTEAFVLADDHSKLAGYFIYLF